MWRRSPDESRLYVADTERCHIRVFDVAPERPANCAFGDPDWRSLYITARTGLYRIRLNVPGIPVP